MVIKKIEQLDQKIQETLNSFTEKYKLDHNVEGILLAGSHVYGDASKNSDLDIFIVNQNIDWRERGNIWINDYEIEFFVNPEKQIYNYMDTESVFRPNTAHMFANGLVIYSKPGSFTLEGLISYAKDVLKKPIPELTAIEKELAKYFLDDTYKDLEDMIDENNFFSYQIIAGEYIQHIIDLFFKIKRNIKEKSKRLPKQLMNLDSLFYDILDSVINSEYDLLKVNELKVYVEQLLGGARRNEWKLRSSLTYTNN